jgi:TetR/AcrR family transcriptional regulator, transcriptional repressor for nem operon
MTDSAQPASADKRDRLVSGARRVFHEQGVEKTTIADIAQAAGVPLGNVYYYFKTKDDIVAAVIGSHIAEVQARLAALDRHRTPKARLKAFIRMLMGQRELAAEYGCPQGTLCSELDKRQDGLAQAAARMIQISLAWSEQQFRAMGRRDARELAVALIAAYQGVALIANSLRDPDVMAREGRRLERWIDSLA